MRVCQIVRNRPLRWHLELAVLMRACGHDVALYRAGGSAEEWPRVVELLISLETLIYRKRGVELVKTIAASELPCLSEMPDDEHFDLAILLIEGFDDEGITATRTIVPQFDGQRNEMGAVAAIVDRRPFTIGFIEYADSRCRRFEFTAALDDALIVANSLANACSRVGEMIAGRVTGHLDECSLTDTAREDAQRSYVCALDLGRHWASALIEKIARRLSILARRGEGWAVGWRALASGQPLALSTGEASYRLIGDDKRRYFADPFLFTYRGETHLFVEDFDYASERGAISVFRRTAEGSFGDRRVVLTRPYHLSYPMIFLDGGQIWMIPECGETGRVEIYRAAEYPYKWLREAVLIENVKAFDATLHRDRRGYWLFVTKALWSSSTGDRLALYYAPRLLGPWKPCGPGTSIFDAGGARCAGMLFAHDGHLIRPAQDCSKIYGGAIQLCSITALNEQRLEQVITGRIEPVDRNRFWGAHTYNIGAGVEVVDVFGCRGSEQEVVLRRSFPADRKIPAPNLVLQ